jgi:hypothetical protein
MAGGGVDLDLAAEHFQALAHTYQSYAATDSAIGGRYVETTAVVGNGHAQMI